MLASQATQGGLQAGHGGPAISLAELRRHLASPSTLADGHRQRLLELERRLGRVRALGSEYARLGLSQFVTSAMDRGVVTV